MTTWHPPIPAGKLYTSEAIDLGPALAMLVWCYDQIDRDGRIEVQLPAVASEIGKPYGTIKDWWRQLRAGPFFCEQVDRGKRGWVVRMSEDWIDWHVMANNYPSKPTSQPSEEQDPPSKSDESRDVNLESGESSVKAASRRRQGRNVNPKNLHIRSHTDQRSNTDVDALYQPMFAAIAAVCQIDLKLCTIAQRNQVAQTTKALLKAGKLPEEIPKVEAWWYVSDWRGKKGEPPRPAQLQEVWTRALENRNGTHQNGRHDNKRPDLAVRRTRQRYDLDD